MQNDNNPIPMRTFAARISKYFRMPNAEPAKEDEARRNLAAYLRATLENIGAIYGLQFSGNLVLPPKATISKAALAPLRFQAVVDKIGENAEELEGRDILRILDDMIAKADGSEEAAAAAVILYAARTALHDERKESMKHKKRVRELETQMRTMLEFREKFARARIQSKGGRTCR